MTITQTVAPHWQYTGDGTQTVFAYTSKILDAADLAVYVDQVVKTLNVDYTVTGVGAANGGTVVFVTPPSAVTVDILRETTADQPRNLPLAGPFPSVTVEAALDDLVNMIQELRRDLLRAPRVSRFSTSSGLTLPTPAALHSLRWKSDATGLENFDPTTVLSAAATLPLALALGGTGTSTPLGARQAFGVDGQVRATLANRSGGPVIAGAVLAFDATGDQAVTLGDTAASKAQFAVALAPLANGATGDMLLAGIAPVNVTGAVTRGHYLRKSATTLVAEDAGVAVSATTDPPQGAFAVALTAAAGGQVVAYCLGSTSPGSPSIPTITGLPRLLGLLGSNNAVTPLTQYDIAATAAVVRDPSTGTTQVLSSVATRTLNVALAGPAAGGRDQAAAFAANTWIHVYLIARTDGTYHVLASLTAPASGGPTLPTGYTLWAYVAALRLDNASALLVTRLHGARVAYPGIQTAFSGVAATTETAISVAALVPPTALAFDLIGSVVCYPANGVQPKLRLLSGVDWLDASGYQDLGYTRIPIAAVVPNLSQTVYLYQTPNAQGTSVISVGGYYVANGDA